MPKPGCLPWTAMPGQHLLSFQWSWSGGAIDQKIVATSNPHEHRLPWLRTQLLPNCRKASSTCLISTWSFCRKAVLSPFWHEFNLAGSPSTASTATRLESPFGKIFYKRIRVGHPKQFHFRLSNPFWSENVCQWFFWGHKTMYSDGHLWAIVG